ncbi:MAG: hypothetical protein COA54_02575 [Thiotrichaceae bacterium]|nr:MAG: hypothetical protein COA54_02575 [Thiotrichaceae bacterium]
MNSKNYLMLVVCSSLALSACGSGGGNGSDTADDDTPVDIPEPENALATFGNLTADDEPLALTTQLETDIEAVFGNADNASTDVLAGDTVQSVIDRAASN